MIGLIGLPIFFVLLLIWSLLHLGIFWPLRNRHVTSVALALSRRANWWLFAVSAITVGLTIYCAALGYWWLALPGVAWLYYYLSLAEDRVVQRTLVSTSLQIRLSMFLAPRFFQTLSLIGGYPNEDDILVEPASSSRVRRQPQLIYT